MTEPEPQVILDAATEALWGPIQVVMRANGDGLYWEVFPEAKGRMGVHRAVGYHGPRCVAVVTARTEWGLVWKMIRADYRHKNRKASA